MLEDVLDAWRTHDDLNLYLLERIPDEGLAAVPSSRTGSHPRGRTVSRVFAHMHDVRLGKLTSGFQGGVPGFEKGAAEPGRARGLPCGVRPGGGGLLTLSQERDERVRNLKRTGVLLLAYLVSPRVAPPGPDHARPQAVGRADARRGEVRAVDALVRPRSGVVNRRCHERQGRPARHLLRLPRGWEAWLAEQPATSAGLWLKIAKKESGIPTVSYAEALEVALCHGWIDGQKDKLDADHWLQRFTPRRPRSKWSRVNRDKATELIEKGLMRPDGLREVERARADGRWEAAYEAQSAATVPDDLQRALEENDAAREFFATLDRANRYAILYRITRPRSPRPSPARRAVRRQAGRGKEALP
jgi:uncharacterized protein YdeI (YjbR/CyaY-like superfamily)